MSESIAISVSSEISDAFLIEIDSFTDNEEFEEIPLDNLPFDKTTFDKTTVLESSSNNNTTQHFSSLPSQLQLQQFVRISEKFENILFVGNPDAKPTYWYLRLPIFTVSVTIVQIVLMVWVVALNGGFEYPEVNPMLGPSAATLVDAGAKWTPYIIWESQGWRLFTAIFLHAGFVHLLSNLLLQIPIGWVLEKRHTSIKVAIVYIFSGIMGNVLSAIFTSPHLATVGASGALFGLISMWTVDVVQNIKRVKYPIGTLVTIVVSILFSFALGLLPIVDNFAHIGGFIAGLELSIMIIPIFTTIPRWKFRVKFGVCIAFAILFFVTFFSLFYVLYYIEGPVSKWCTYCYVINYINCIPNANDETNWCLNIVN